MNIKPIFAKVVFGAAEASLDIAGVSLLPGAWPILKGAIEPVLDRLKERLGGEDITSSREQAQAAVKEFDNDPHLQEMLRSKLLEALDTVVNNQQAINSDVQKLMLIVTGDQKLLVELVGRVERIEQQIEKGVNLSDEAVDKLTRAVSNQAESSRRIRAIALREMGPVAELVGRQVNRLQARAVELVDERQLDRANDELREGLLLVSALLSEAPTDINLQMQLAMIYKTIAQVFQAVGNIQEADNYIDRAETVFRYVKDVVPGDQKSALDAANAIHGMGNMKQMRDEYESAIENYKMATNLYPNHCYAWHDMFLCYYELARRGQVNLNAMHYALEKAKATGEGVPGLGAQHFAKLEEIVSQLEKYVSP